VSPDLFYVFKQTHFHHKALCKLQILWNSIHCTAIKQNKHQVQTHDCCKNLRLVHETGRYFFIYPPYKCIGIIFKKTDCYYAMTLYGDKFLPFSCSNRGGKVNIELHIDWSTPTPTAPQPQFCLTNPEPKEFFIFHSSFNDFQFIIFFDYLFSRLSLFTHKNSRIYN
jgi:hypothetical protein